MAMEADIDLMIVDHADAHSYAKRTPLSTLKQRNLFTFAENIDKPIDVDTLTLENFEQELKIEADRKVDPTLIESESLSESRPRSISKSKQVQRTNALSSILLEIDSEGNRPTNAAETINLQLTEEQVARNDCLTITEKDINSFTMIEEGLRLVLKCKLQSNVFVC